MAEFELKALITGVDRLSPALGRMQKNLRRFRKDAEEAGRGGMVMAGGLAAGLTGSLVAFAKQEDAATGLKVAMMDASGAVSSDFGKINKLAIGLGNKLPGTTADFQNMMQMLVRQGIPAQNILNGVGEASAYLAVQLKKTPEDAAEFAAKMQDATRTASEDMMGLFDTIQKAFYLGVDDTNMLSFFTNVSSVTKMVSKDGLTAARSLAPIAVMMDQMGTQGETAGNAIRKIFQAGFDTKKMKAANKLLGRKGIKLDFTDGKGEFGGIENLFKQLKKLQSLSTLNRTRIIKEIFGDDGDTLSVLNALIDKGKSGYDEIQAKMNKQADLNKRVNAQLGTLTNLWDSMTGTAVNGLAAIGGAFSGDAKKLVGWLGDMSQRFSEFAEKNPKVIRGAFGIAAGFVGMKLGLLGINFALGILGQGLKLSPMGIFLRLAALGIGLLISDWDKFGPVVENVWTKIDGLTEALGGMNGIITGIGGVMAGSFTLQVIGSLTTATAKASGLLAVLTQIGKLSALTVSIAVALYMFKKLEEISDATTQKDGTESFWESLKKRWKAGGWYNNEQQLKGGSVPLNPQSMSGPLMRDDATSQKGEIKVSFENAPPGMRVEPSGSALPWFDLDVGYNRFSTPN
ncbi:phage tail tape measure protein [Enterobacteriaceae bacterium EKM102V]|uniref:phage tail tape measure protein n=1 Tax=Pantoea TaxID=53335 RepID=UPI00142D41ED|nr:phage tail tape measure protein [Enterobacteriaceae bacterium EKM102V]KAF6668236.1 phage tail tape measure protein [Pantoea sp. EKM103V]